MKELTIRIEDYLSEEEIKEIAKEEVRGYFRSKSPNDMERVICNSAYQAIWDAVEEVYDGEAETVLKNKVVEILEELVPFNVFNKPNAWDKAENAPYTTLCDVVKEDKELLDERVKQSIGQLTKKDMKEVAMKLMEQKLRHG